MLGNLLNYMRLDVHHYMELLELKGQLVRGDAANDNAANDNAVHGTQPSGGNEAVA